MGPWLVIAFLGGGPAAGQIPSIEGTWRGTSTCVDQRTDTACRNEQVIYLVKSAGGRKDSADVAASKMVAGKPEPMGDLGMRWDPKAGEWAMEFTAPSGFHGRWAFRPEGGRMTGSLIELPSRRLVRRVETTRSQP